MPSEHLFARPGIDRLAEQAGEVVVEDRQRAFIDRAQDKAAVKHEHAGREVGQDRLQIGARRFDFGAVALGSRRASSSWRVMRLNDWVSTPSSSRL
jgi:nucleotide-binding universal stress UspA family protein